MSAFRLTPSKNFGLKDQMQRSAISIPSNIAEGSERDSDGDFIRFPPHQQRLLRRTPHTALHQRTRPKSTRSGANRRFARDDRETREISAMLQGLIRSIQSRKP
jgi:hypothetical protein